MYIACPAKIRSVCSTHFVHKENVDSKKTQNSNVATQKCLPQNQLAPVKECLISLESGERSWCMVCKGTDITVRPLKLQSDQ